MPIGRLNLAPVLIDDLPGDRQPQTVAVPVDARAPPVERNKQLHKLGFRHARTPIFNADDGFAGPYGETNPDPAAGAGVSQGVAQQVVEQPVQRLIKRLARVRADRLVNQVL